MTLARPTILAQAPQETRTLLVSCIHGDIQEVPTSEEWVSTSAFEWLLLIGLIPELPVLLLLGLDWPGFPTTSLSLAAWGRCRCKPPAVQLWVRQKELMLLFSRVGIPKEILTDQGMPFMSKLMVDLYQLLQVKHLRTSVYHHQTDDLVESFNQTLKQML